MLKDAFTAYGVQDYTVVQKGDVRIAVWAFSARMPFPVRPPAS